MGVLRALAMSDSANNSLREFGEAKADAYFVILELRFISADADSTTDRIGGDRWVSSWITTRANCRHEIYLVDFLLFLDQLMMLCTAPIIGAAMWQIAVSFINHQCRFLAMNCPPVLRGPTSAPGSPKLTLHACGPFVS